MDKGENYRLTNILEIGLRKNGYEFICGDVMCRYKNFSKKVAQLEGEDGELLFPELSDSKYLLGRMHAYAHVWYCQVFIYW